MTSEREDVSFAQDPVSELATGDGWAQLDESDDPAGPLGRQCSSARDEPMSPPRASELPPPRVDMFGYGGQKRSRANASMSSVGAGHRARLPRARSPPALVSCERGALAQRAGRACAPAPSLSQPLPTSPNLSPPFARSE